VSVAVYTTSTVSTCVQPPTKPGILYKKEQSSSVTFAVSIRRGETSNLLVEVGVTTQIQGMAVEIHTGTPQAGIAGEMYCLR
jgi:hypothetical protein